MSNPFYIALKQNLCSDFILCNENRQHNDHLGSDHRTKDFGAVLIFASFSSYRLQLCSKDRVINRKNK